MNDHIATALYSSSDSDIDDNIFICSEKLQLQESKCEEISEQIFFLLYSTQQLLKHF